MYIRTKDGVYELVDNLYQYHNGVEKFWYAKEENGTTLAIEITANEILKQSENLEELCDGFYIDEGNEFSFYEENAYEDFEEAKKDFFTNFDQTSTLYAFIKTSKGLIYVAKMNESGDLIKI